MDLTKKYIKMVNWLEIQDRKPDFNADGENQNFVANYHFAKACPTHGKVHLWTKDLDNDHFCCTYGQPHISVDGIPDISPYEEKDAYKVVWLPRQDQLEIMSGLGWEQFDEQCFMAANLYLKSQGEEYCANEIATLISKEQAGIMVVMNELYQKQWKNGKWI